MGKHIITPPITRHTFPYLVGYCDLYIHEISFYLPEGVFTNRLSITLLLLHTYKATLYSPRLETHQTSNTIGGNGLDLLND